LTPPSSSDGAALLDSAGAVTASTMCDSVHTTRVNLIRGSALGVNGSDYTRNRCMHCSLLYLIALPHLATHSVAALQLHGTPAHSGTLRLSVFDFAD